MSNRKRDYIPLPEKLAATLACFLPQDQRDDLRSRKVPASEVLSLFHFDHIVLHAFDGSDLWWNLDPKLVKSHREKSKRDTSIVAKAKRLNRKWANPKKVEDFFKRKKYWPKKKMESRKGELQRRAEWAKRCNDQIAARQSKALEEANNADIIKANNGE